MRTPGRKPHQQAPAPRHSHRRSPEPCGGTHPWLRGRTPRSPAVGIPRLINAQPPAGDYLARARCVPVVGKTGALTVAHGTNDKTMTCVTAGRAGGSRSLPNWCSYHQRCLTEETSAAHYLPSTAAMNPSGSTRLMVSELTLLLRNSVLGCRGV